MAAKKRTKLVREGRYVAEVLVTLVEDETGWSPYLASEGVYLLDDVRAAFRDGDLAKAAEFTRVFKLSPVEV